ncbi:MAG: TonB-dependent receptor [Pseudomonadota bacterium]
MLPQGKTVSLLLATTLLTTIAAPAISQDAPPEELGSTFLGRLIFGTGAPKVAIDVPQSVTAIEEEDFDRAQPSTVGDVIEQAPGVSMVGSESRFGESINIRGFGTGLSSDEPRIITLIDGVRKYYESYRQGSLFTDPEFFNRVEILRGPSSSTLYGSGAVGGVVAFETKDASQFLEPGDPFAVKQALEFRSNGGSIESSTFLAFAPDEQFETLVGFIYDDSDFLKDGAGNDVLGTRITETNTLLKFGYAFGDTLDHRVEAAYIRYDGEAERQLLDVIDNANEVVFGPPGTPPSFFGIVDRTVVDDTVALTYNYNPDSPLVNLDVSLGYSRSENVIENYTGSFGVSFDSDYAYESYSLRVANTSEWIGDRTENYLTFGAELYRQERITERATPANAAFQPEGTTRTLGIFAQNEWILNDTFTVLAGGRLDFQETEPGPLVPTTIETNDTAGAATLALRYQSTDALAFFGSLSYTERLPVVDELYDSRVTTGGDQVSAGTLDPENSVNFEIGAAYAVNDVFTEGDALDLKVTAYQHRVRDLIARDNTAGAGDPIFANIDEVEFTGLELEGAYDSERFFAALALTIQDGENISNPGDPNPSLENRIPANELRVLLGHRVPEYNLELGWEGTYYQSKSRVSGGTTINTSSELIHDVYAAWTPDQGVLEGAEVRLGVSNLLDEDYRTHLQSDLVRRAGRSINLTLTKSF